MKQLVVSPVAELRRRGELDGGTLARLDAWRLRASERGVARSTFDCMRR